MAQAQGAAVVTHAIPLSLVCLGGVAGLARLPQEEVATAGPATHGSQKEATFGPGAGYFEARGHSRWACHGAGELLAKNCPQCAGPSMADCAGVT